MAKFKRGPGFSRGSCRGPTSGAAGIPGNPGSAMTMERGHGETRHSQPAPCLALASDSYGATTDDCEPSLDPEPRCRIPPV